MNRSLLAVLALSGAMSALSCGKTPPALPQPTLPLSGPAHFPLAAGNSWTYASELVLGGTPEQSTKTYTVSLAAAPDGSGAFAIDLEGRGLLNKITMVYAKTPQGVVTHRGYFGQAKTEFTPAFVDLPETVAPNATWGWKGTTSGKPLEIGSVLEGMESLTVPAGTFRCARIRRTASAGGTTTHWYAEGVGLVKMEVTRPAAALAPASHEVMTLTSYRVN